MFAYTKFKIASKLMCAPQIKCFSTGSQSNGSEGKNSEPTKLNTQELCKKNPNGNTFICGANATYMEYLFSKWIKDPSSVHKSWQLYFRDIITCSDNAHIKQTPTSDGKTKKVESETKAIRLFGNVDIAPKTIKEYLSKKQNSNGTTESAGAGIGAKQPFQESDCVLGQITFTPKKEEKSQNAVDEYMTVKRLIEDIPTSAKQPSNNKHKTNFDNNMAEHLKTMVKVKAALDKEPCVTNREYIKKKLEQIAKKKMQKSLQQLKEDSQIMAKQFKPVEMPKK